MTRLRVTNLSGKHSHKGMAFVNDEILNKIGDGAHPGCIVNIVGSRETSALLGVDNNLNCEQIAIDATSRLNAGVTVEGIVEIESEAELEIKKIQFARVGQIPEENLELKLKDKLGGRVISQGDHLTVAIPGGVVELQAVKCRPRNGVIGANSDVFLRPKQARRPLMETTDISFSDIGGLDSAISILQDCAIMPMLHPEIFIHANKEPIKGVMLHGEPGTGKSLLAKALARESQSNFISISAPEIIEGVYGESEKRLRAIFKEAKKKSPCVIFIDEIDAVTTSRDDVNGELEKRLVTQLLTLMDGMEDRGHVIVIGATNRLDSIDPALRRAGRFEREVECRIPDKDGRVEILHIHTRGMPISEDVSINELAFLTVGFTGADLDLLCREVVYQGAKRQFGEETLNEDYDIDENILSKLKFTMEDFVDAIDHVRPSVKRRFEIEIPKVSMDDVIGLKNAKKTLIDCIIRPLDNPELHELAGLKMSHGVLFFGPPGTGKTMLAKAVANLAGVQFLQVKGPELLSKWVGDSEKAVRNIFNKARKMSPCVLFLDEMDALIPDRRSIGEGSKALSSVVNQFLCELDGIESRDGVIVIGATNRLELIDEACLRPGRLGTQIAINLPSPNDYASLLGVHLRDAVLDPGLDIRGKAIELPNGLSGADIYGLTVSIKQAAVERHLESEKNMDEFKIMGCDVDKIFNEIKNQSARKNTEVNGHTILPKKIEV